MQITQLVQQKKRNRFNLIVDGSFWCGISASVLAKYNLYQGKEVSEQLLDDIFRADIEGRLYDRCIRMIGLRPRSLREVRQYLEKILWKRGKEWLKDTKYQENTALLDEIQEAVIAHLEKQQLLDDSAFARWWTEQRIRNGMKGWNVIRMELLAKGVDSKIVDQYAVGEQGDLAVAKRAYQKYCTRAGVTREQCIRRLLSRGFSWDIVKKLTDLKDGDELPME